MAEYANNKEFQLPFGIHTVQFESASSGTGKLQSKDGSDPDSGWVDVPNSSKSASTSFLLEASGGVSYKVVLTGDMKCFVMNAAGR